jgi:signal transduction histidine kinase
MAARHDKSRDLKRSRLPRLARTRGLLLALLLGVMLPVVLSTAAGIVSVALGEGASTLIIGVLVISFAVTAIGGAVALLVLLSRRARVARQQADLLANVSHELKTPLASIRMLTQTLQHDQVGGDPQQRRECLATVERQTRWLEAMIERVLSWRSAPADRGALELQRGPLGPAVEQAVERFRQMLEPGEVEVDLALGCPHAVDHDVEAVGLMAINLLVNAHKYGGDERWIGVGLQRRGDTVELSVTDRGPGIPPAERERIFEPFYRVDDRLGSRAAGTGLGLAIVRHLAAAHGGRAGVDDGPGSGSRFWVRLPIAERSHG